MTYSEYYLQRKSRRVLQSTNLGLAVCAPSAYSPKVSCYVFVSSPLAEPLRLCASALEINHKSEDKDQLA